MTDEKLFTEFPPISTEEWESAIHRDLKGADYGKKLMWRTDEGFVVRPYYRAEDLKDIDYLNTLPGQFPYTRGTKAHGNAWQIVQEIDDTDPAVANAVALDAVRRGAGCVAFNMSAVENAAQLAGLLKDIDLGQVGVQFNNVKDFVALMKVFVQFVEDGRFDKNAVRGSLDFDPLMYRLRHGRYYRSREDDMGQTLRLLGLAKDMPGFKVVNVNGITMHNAGSTIVQELAFSLSLANEYISFCTGHDVEADDIASKMQLTLSVGSQYFMEIAKLRAVRLLWATMLTPYSPKCDCAYKIHVNTVASTWNKTIYDPYVNMLRSTTEGMSAALGGSDSISLQPFDVAYRQPDDFSRRIARNVQVILKEEAYMDRVADPAAGSYYIENLTNSIAENAWNLFRELEAAGGAAVAIEKDTIRDAIAASCQKRDMDIATRRCILLGTNQFPNVKETMGDKIERIAEDRHEGLKTYRGAEAFEEIRLATEKYAKNRRRPQVYLFKIGNLAMRQARAGFITNFFGCAGYGMIEPAGFASVDEGLKALDGLDPDMIVVCSSDEEYATLGIEAVLKLKTIYTGKPVLVAGNPADCIGALKKAGADDFIHVRTNILESLKKYNRLLLQE